MKTFRKILVSIILLPTIPFLLLAALVKVVCNEDDVSGKTEGEQWKDAQRNN